MAISVRDVGDAGLGSIRDAVFIINNITMDCVDDKIHLVPIETDGVLFYVIGATQKIDVKDYTRRVFLNILDISQKVVGVSFVTAMSGVADSAEEIPNLYKEAVSSMEYADFYGIEQFISYEEMKGEFTELSVEYYKITDENILIHNIREGMLQEAVEKVDRLLEFGDDKKHPRKWHLNWMVNNIISTIIKSVEYLDDTTREEFGKLLNEIENCSGIIEIKSALKDLLEFCVQANTGNDIKDKNVCEDIKEYVNQNITDSNLNVSQIGEKFNMSSLYLSRMFKNYTGIKLHNYINNQRIELVKELLINDKDLKLEYVAARAGFYNMGTFLRVFKEYEGITPTQFKNLNEKS